LNVALSNALHAGGFSSVSVGSGVPVLNGSGSVAAGELVSEFDCDDVGAVSVVVASSVSVVDVVIDGVDAVSVVDVGVVSISVVIGAVDDVGADSSVAKIVTAVNGHDLSQFIFHSTVPNGTSVVSE
jgi:hypothetical protein